MSLNMSSSVYLCFSLSLSVQLPRPSYNAGPALDGTRCELPAAAVGKCSAGKCVAVTVRSISKVATAPEEKKKPCRSGCLKRSKGFRIVSDSQGRESKELCEQEDQEKRDQGERKQEQRTFWPL